MKSNKNIIWNKSNKRFQKKIYLQPRVVSDIFLENLKAATPWKIKIINTKLLYARIEKGISMPKLHIATHLSNLLKISEQVSVRHYAGETLVRLAPLLSFNERNEVALELTKGLEMGEFEFSKYIPQYLGQLHILHPEELDEFLQNLEDLLVVENDRICDIFASILRSDVTVLSEIPKQISGNDNFL